MCDDTVFVALVTGLDSFAVDAVNVGVGACDPVGDVELRIVGAGAIDNTFVGVDDDSATVVEFPGGEFVAVDVAAVFVVCR